MRGALDVAVEFNSLSKTYNMAGLRIGMLMGNPQVVEAIGRIKSNMDSGVPTIVQQTALAALTGDQGEVERMRAAFEKRRAVMVEGLRSIPGVRCRMPEGAFYAFADCRSLYGIHYKGKPIASDEDIAFFLLDEAHVAAVPGGAFGAPGYVRFSYATSEERIRGGIAAIHRAVEAAKRG